MSVVPRGPLASRLAPAAIALAAVAFLFAATGTRARAADVTWTFAHTTPVKGSTFDRYATTVVPERILKATGGRLQINVVQGIIAPQDLLKSVRAGRVQAGSLIMAYAAANYPRWVVLGLPGILKNEANYVPAVEQVILPVIQKEAGESWGSKSFAVGAFTGVGVFSSKPIETVDQFVGLKFRTASPEQAQLVQVAGGAAVSMPFGEVYTSMQRGLVAAFTGSGNSVVDSKMHEIVGHAAKWPIGLNIWSFFVGTDALAKLPDDLRKMVESEFSEIHKDALREGLLDADKGWKRVTNAGVKLHDLQPAEFAKAVALARDNVWPNWLQRAGPDGDRMLKEIQALDK